MTAAHNVHFLSSAGDGEEEQKSSKPRAVPAAEDNVAYKDVDDFVRSADPRYLQCREGRHFYARTRIQDLKFKRDGLGYDIAEIPCEVCHEAYQKKKYLIVENDAGEILKVTFLGNTTGYYRPDEGGRNPYLLPPGSGYMSPTDIHESRANAALVGKTVKRKTTGRST